MYQSCKAGTSNCKGFPFAAAFGLITFGGTNCRVSGNGSGKSENPAVADGRDGGKEVAGL